MSQSVNQSVSQSVCLSVCLSVYLSIYLSIYLPTSTFSYRGQRTDGNLTLVCGEWKWGTTEIAFWWSGGDTSPRSYCEYAECFYTELGFRKRQCRFTDIFRQTRLVQTVGPGTAGVFIYVYY